MENNRIPFSQIIIDGLVTEAREKGYKGKDLDGYVSLAIKQRGERVMMEVDRKSVV